MSCIYIYINEVYSYKFIKSTWGPTPHLVFNAGRVGRLILTRMVPGWFNRWLIDG